MKNYVDKIVNVTWCKIDCAMAPVLSRSLGHLMCRTDWQILIQPKIQFQIFSCFLCSSISLRTFFNSELAAKVNLKRVESIVSANEKKGEGCKQMNLIWERLCQDPLTDISQHAVPKVHMYIVVFEKGFKPFNLQQQQQRKLLFELGSGRPSLGWYTGKLFMPRFAPAAFSSVGYNHFSNLYKSPNTEVSTNIERGKIPWIWKVYLNSIKGKIPI